MRNKFLMVHQGFELYGSDRSFISTLQAFKQKLPDCHLTVIIPRSGPIVEALSPYADELIIKDIGVISFSEAKRHPISSILKVIKSAFRAKKRINNADAIYINTIVPFGYLLAGFFTLKPVIVHVREIPSPLLAVIFSVWFKLSGFFTIYNSRSTQKAFYLNSSKKSHVLWNGVEALEYDASLPKESDRIGILLIGRINRWKGQKFFLEAFSLLSDKEKNGFKIYIVGDTPLNQHEYKKDLESFIHDNSLEHIVSLYPFDKNPQKYYSWADIVAVPSIQPEPFGRVAIEAMSLAKPVIASNHGGLSEIVTDQETGFLFESNNSDALHAVLRHIISNPGELPTLGERGMQRYQKHFTLTAYQNNVFEIFRNIYKLDKQLYINQDRINEKID